LEKCSYNSVEACGVLLMSTGKLGDAMYYFSEFTGIDLLLKSLVKKAVSRSERYIYSALQLS
jgi:hypothetical protein